MPGEASVDARLPSPGGNKARFLLSTDEHYLEGQRSTVLRTTVASVALHVIKAKAKKTVLPVREKWDRHKEPVSPYFRFSSSRERSERLDSALSRRSYQ